MLLRSVNVQTTVRGLGGFFKVASVQYDGPILEFAVITARVDLVGLQFTFGHQLSFGLRVLRLTDPTISSLKEVAFCLAGLRTSMTEVLLSPLTTGDVIEFHVRSSFGNTWAVVAQGFTVVIS